MSWRQVSYVMSTGEDYVWGELDYFTSPDNVKKVIGKKYPSLYPRTVETKAIEISSCIKQAQEFYRSAKLVDYVTKPLLLFFGMESLTRALNIILKKNLTMRNFKNSHGVEFIKHKLKENEIDLSKILIKIQKSGTFSELFKLELFDWALPKHINSERDLSNYSAGLKAEEDKMHFINCNVRLRDLLSIIPEIYQDYIKIFDDHPNIFSGQYIYYWKGEKADKIELFIDKRTNAVTREFIIKKLPMLGKGYEVEEKENHFKFTCTPDQDEPILCEDMYEDNFVKGKIQVFKGETLELFNKKLGLLDIEAHFLIMFALSILSRYELKLWYSLMTEKKGGIDYLIKRFVESSSCKYPLLVLREIYGLNIRQRTPGTIIKRYR